MTRKYDTKLFNQIRAYYILNILYIYGNMVIVKEVKNMTTYRFTKNGCTYTEGGNNIFSAKLSAELRWGIDLTGAAFEEVWKLKVVRTGIVK